MGFLSKSKYRYQTPKYWKYLSPIHIFQSNQRKIFFSLNWTLIPFSKDCQKIPKPFKFFPIKVMKSLLIGKEVFNPCSKNFMAWNLLFNITCHNIPKKSLLIQIKIFGSRLISKKRHFCIHLCSWSCVGICICWQFLVCRTTADTQPSLASHPLSTTSLRWARISTASNSSPNTAT